MDKSSALFHTIVNLKILFLRSVTPLCFLYLVYTHVFPRIFNASTEFSSNNTQNSHNSGLTSSSNNAFGFSLLSVYALVEILFFVAYRLNHMYLENHRPIPVDAVRLDRDDRFQLFLKCINSVRNGKRYLSGWFKFAPFEKICRGDVCRFLAWGFFVSEPDDLDDDETVEIGEMIDVMERKFGTFPEGDNHLPCIRLNFDPIAPKHRPFVYYVVIWTVGKFFAFLMYLMGFRKYYSRHHPLYRAFKSSKADSDAASEEDSVVGYWIRRGKSETRKSKEPIVFFHGIGVGLMSYYKVLHSLVSTDGDADEKDVFVFENPQVSTLFFPFYKSLLDTIQTPRDYADIVAETLEKHGHSKAQLVGHSLGSTIVSWCIKFRPDIVSRTILVDPVCFLLHKPDVAYNFIHRPPSTGFELIIHWFASRELYVSWFLARCFIWYENVLFLQDIPADIEVSVVLANQDCVIPFAEVANYLKGRIKDLYILNGVNHGEFLLRPFAINLVSQMMLGIQPKLPDDGSILHFAQDLYLKTVDEDSGYNSSSSN